MTEEEEGGNVCRKRREGAQSEKRKSKLNQSGNKLMKLNAMNIIGVLYENISAMAGENAVINIRRKQRQRKHGG